MTKTTEATTAKTRKPRKSKAANANTHTDTTSTVRTVIGKYAKMNTVMTYHESRHTLAVIGESADNLIKDSGKAQWNGSPLSSLEDSHLANIYKKCKESYELHAELEMSSTGIYGVTFKEWVKYIKVESFIRKIKFLSENWFATVGAIAQRGVELQHHIAEKNLGIAGKIESSIATLKSDAEYIESEMNRIFGLINELVEYPIGTTSSEEYEAELDELTTKYITRITEAIEVNEAENQLAKAFAELFS